MHQIVGLRDIHRNGEVKTVDTFYEKNWTTGDLKDLFKKWDSLISSIPTDERWNIFFTVAHCTGRREFLKQKYIPFDIDDIDTTRAPLTVEVALKALGLEWGNTLSLFSGNGVQFFVELKEFFDDPDYFDKNRPYYKAACQRIDKALKEKNIPGKADTTVFSLARLMRFPKTWNVKPNKPRVMAEIIQDNSTPIEFGLREMSGIPEVPKEETLAAWPPVDEKAVLEGCLNLRKLKENPESVSEPLWYGALSILGRISKDKVHARAVSHEYSKPYSKYDPRETDHKLEQALLASGPRTCSNMSNLPGSECERCPNYQKVKSPILLKGPDYIATKETGFHRRVIGADGRETLGTPVYEDLYKYFYQVHPYVIHEDSRQLHLYNGRFYEKKSKLYIESFAEKNFTKCDTKKSNEFYGKVTRRHLVHGDWFTESTEYKMNFLNGILDVRTGEFVEGHTKDMGFLYEIPYEYSKDAKAPRFEKFLDEVTLGNKELQTQLLEFGGYCLSNDEYWEHKAMLLVGSGSNGKSVFLEVLKLVAENGYSSLSMRDISNDQKLASLEGMLFNVSEEGSHNALRETDIFKTLTTGGQIQVKVVYQRPYTIKNRAKLIFSCNELPQNFDHSYGFYRRMIIVPFNALFDKSNKDPFILSKLSEERAGILNLMLDAYRKAKERGYFLESSESTAAIEQFKYDNDPVLQWIKERVVLTDKEGTLTSEDLYTNYSNYCESSGIRPANKNNVCKSLAKILGKKTSVVWKDGKACRVWSGLELIEENV